MSSLSSFSDSEGYGYLVTSLMGFSNKHQLSYLRNVFKQHRQDAKDAVIDFARQWLASQLKHHAILANIAPEHLPILSHDVVPVLGAKSPTFLCGFLARFSQAEGFHDDLEDDNHVRYHFSGSGGARHYYTKRLAQQPSPSTYHRYHSTATTGLEGANPDNHQGHDIFGVEIIVDPTAIEPSLLSSLTDEFKGDKTWAGWFANLLGRLTDPNFIISPIIVAHFDFERMPCDLTPLETKTSTDKARDRLKINQQVLTESMRIT